MFNSPLQYCALCKQYVELDQTMEECVAQHGCHGHDCPLTGQFSAPLPIERQADPSAGTPGKCGT